jgi:hypothetical protein
MVVRHGLVNECQAIGFQPIFDISRPRIIVSQADTEPENSKVIAPVFV